MQLVASSTSDPEVVRSVPYFRGDHEIFSVSLKKGCCPLQGRVFVLSTVKLPCPGKCG